MALMIAGVIAAGCGGAAKSDGRQVHVPAVPQEAPPSQTTPAQPPSGQIPPAPAPTQQTPPQAKQPLAPKYEPVPPLPTNAPALLKAIDAAGWKLSGVRPSLPPQEGAYSDRSGENPSYKQYAFSGGALRLYAGGDSIFAVLVDTNRSEYAAFKQVAGATQLGHYAVVARQSPLTADTYSALGAGARSLDELKAALGAPSYGYHLHGIGTMVYDWVPQALSFEGPPSELKLISRGTPGEFWKGVAGMLAGDLNGIEAALSKGKPSPDGRYVAGQLSLGGYWDNWIVIRAAGKAEQRYQADYFIVDYHWLDDHTVIYCEGSTFRAIDVSTGETRIAANVQGFVRSFGVAGPNKIWYAGDDKVKHELTLN